MKKDIENLVFVCFIIAILGLFNGSVIIEIIERGGIERYFATNVFADAVIAVIATIDFTFFFGLFLWYDYHKD